MGQLSAPFPYYGGKARIALAVWRELGDVTVYAEPFAGSLAVLLASEPHRREIVCDTDGHIEMLTLTEEDFPEKEAFRARVEKNRALYLALEGIEKKGPFSRSRKPKAQGIGRRRRGGF